MHNLPQANIVNPAVPIECKLFVGFPVVGSTHVNVSSTGFALNDVLLSTDSDSLLFDPEQAIEGFNNKEIVSSEVHLSLISAGYKYKKNYFTFGINEKINSYSILNKTALQLANGGTTQFEGENVRTRGTRVNAIHYREYALGWARELNDRLSFGIRFKFLFGKASVYTKPVELNIYTDPVTFESYVNGDGEMYTSFPVDVRLDSDDKIDALVERGDEADVLTSRDYLMNKENKGYGFDFGFIYKINDKTTLSGSLLDIGYINWKSDARKLTSGGSMDVTHELINDGLLNLEEVTDSIADLYTPTVTEENYSSPLVPAMYMGISRIMTSWLDVGAVFHSEIYSNAIHPSLTFSGNTAITKNIYGSVSYTAQNKEFNNIGLGLGAKLGMIHLHAVSDNFPGLFDLGSTRNANLRFGLSMLFGCGRERSKNQKDKGIRAVPCMGDPYRAVKTHSRIRR